MKLGVDLSIQEELDALGAKYYYRKKLVEPFSFFATHSHISMVRLRLWHHPYDEKGQPYGGGTNDLETTLKLARRARDNGMGIILDFHYSDFWVDPSRQKLPKAWASKSFKEVKELLFNYTKDTLLLFKKENINVVAVQVGNEITHGMLFPFGDINLKDNIETGGGFLGHVTLFNAGSEAAKSVYPDVKVICHIEHAASKDLQDWYFSKMNEYGAKYDVIGESFYPYWHGSLNEFKESISFIKDKFNKEIWVMEMGYEYAKSKVKGHHSEYQEDGSGMFIEGNINGRIPFPLTKTGQKEYLKHFLKICKDIGVGAVNYWEPTWVLMKNNGWAKPAGQRYCDLKVTKAYNDWANETLFDFKGHANSGINIFTQDYVDKL